MTFSKIHFQRFFIALLLCLVSVGSISCQKRSVAEVFDDSTLAMRLRSKLVKHNRVPSHKIYLKVREGVVTVKGELPSQDIINKTIELIEVEKGVKEVKAYLVLKEFGKLKDQDNAFKNSGKNEFDENSSWEEIDLGS